MRKTSKAVIKKLNLSHCEYCGAIAEYSINRRFLCSLHYNEEMRYINQGQGGYSAKSIKTSWAFSGVVNKELGHKFKKNLLESEIKSIIARNYLVELLDNFYSGKINLLISYDNNHCLTVELDGVCFICLVQIGYNPVNLRDDFITGRIEVCYKRVQGRIVEYYK